MADVLNSYGELYFYKDDLEKAEKFHLEALALWEIHSEENDWKILNQIIYLVDVFLQQGNLTDLKTFSAKLYESNSNLDRNIIVFMDFITFFSQKIFMIQKINTSMQTSS